MSSLLLMYFHWNSGFVWLWQIIFFLDWHNMSLIVFCLPFTLFGWPVSVVSCSFCLFLTPEASTSAAFDSRFLLVLMFSVFLRVASLFFRVTEVFSPPDTRSFCTDDSSCWLTPITLSACLSDWSRSILLLSAHICLWRHQGSSVCRVLIPLHSDGYALVRQCSSTKYLVFV